MKIKKTGWKFEKNQMTNKNRKNGERIQQTTTVL